MPAASSPSSSSLSPWLLPALAVVVVLGVLASGIWFGSEEQRSSAEGKPRVAQSTADRSASGEIARVIPPAPVTAAASPVTAAPAAVLVAPAPLATGTPSGSATPVADRDSLIDTQPDAPALAPGEPATARVTVGGRSTPPLSPNQIGAFPRVYLPLGGRAEVKVQLPEAAAGDQVIASVEDGGRFLDGKPVQAFTLDENRQISFQFQASQSLGNFRVRVRHGTDSKVVTFWAGDRTSAINR